MNSTRVLRPRPVLASHGTTAFAQAVDRRCGK